MAMPTLCFCNRRMLFRNETRFVLDDIPCCTKECYSWAEHQIDQRRESDQQAQEVYAAWQSRLREKAAA
jgi:hypothetical protein